MAIDKIVFRYDENDRNGLIEYYDEYEDFIDEHNFDDISYDMFRSMYAYYTYVSMDIKLDFVLE